MASSVLSGILLPSGVKLHPQTLYSTASYCAKNKANWRIFLGSHTQAPLVPLFVSLLLSQSLPLFCLCLYSVSFSHMHFCSSRPLFLCPDFASAR